MLLEYLIFFVELTLRSKELGPNPIYLRFFFEIINFINKMNTRYYIK